VKLRYALRAAAELNEVLAYIEHRSPLGARHVQARIQMIIDLLLQHPMLANSQATAACEEWSFLHIRI
jgi:plasmid stabilization system protein ParE